MTELMLQVHSNPCREVAGSSRASYCGIQATASEHQRGRGSPLAEGLVHIEAGLSDRRGDAVQRCGCPGGISGHHQERKNKATGALMSPPPPHAFPIPADAKDYGHHLAGHEGAEATVQPEWLLHTAANPSEKTKLPMHELTAPHIPPPPTMPNPAEAAEASLTAQVSWQLLVSGKQCQETGRSGVTLHPETEATG